MNEKIYDYVVIGGGIAGLYANYKLFNNNKDGILLEAESYLGGRAKEIMFHGKLIRLGAGIMDEKNIHLLKLLNKLNVEYSSFFSKTTTFLEPFDMKTAIKQIKTIYNTHKKKVTNITSLEFLNKYFDKNFVKEFLANCEYRDFLHSDIGYFINYYDIGDMSHETHKVLTCKWIDLIDKLKLPNCICNHKVNKIIKLSNKMFKIDDKYIAKKIYLSLTLKPLVKLTSNLINFNYNDYIGTVEFVRIYTYHKTPYDQTKIGHYNIVNNQLEKIIKITPNILMASYSDDKGARYWKNISKQSKIIQIKKVEEKLKELNININKVDDVIIQWWDEGVHYYRPFRGKTINYVIKKLSQPIKNMYVIGEIVSKKHGWVEGAIQSVNWKIKD